METGIAEEYRPLTAIAAEFDSEAAGTWSFDAHMTGSLAEGEFRMSLQLLQQYHAWIHADHPAMLS